MAKTKVLERKPLTFAEKTFLPQIVSGLKTTFGTMMQKDVTLQYPEERPNIPDNYRGVPTLVKDPNGAKNVFPANSASSFVRPKRFVSHLARLTLKQSQSALMSKKLRRNSISTCSAASTAASAKKSVPKRRSFCRMFSHSLATVVRR